jgi:8-oxo-dGTP pyrophosphatase MutT (NUDIX family)
MAEQVADKNRHRVIGKCIVYRRDPDDIRYLVGKRRPDRHMPDLWTTLGGGMDREDYESEPSINGSWNSPLDAALTREIDEEAGIKVGPFQYLGNFTFIRPKDDIPVFGIGFAAEYKSGDVRLTDDEFVEHGWITAEEAPNYEFTGTVGQEIQELDKILKAR